MLARVLLCTLLLAAQATSASPPDLARLSPKYPASRDYAQAFVELSRRSQGIESNDQNGFSLLMAAVSAVEKANDDAAGHPMGTAEGDIKWVVDLAKLIDSPSPDPAELETGRRLLAAMKTRGVFTKLHDLSKLRGTARPKEVSLLMRASFSEIPPSRVIARAERMRMRLAAQEKHWDECADAAVETAALAKAFLRRGTIAENLVGIACASALVREAGAIAASPGGGVPAPTLRRLLAAADSLPAADLVSAVDCDRLATFEAIERCVPNAGDADTAPAPELLKRAAEMFDLMLAAAHAPTPAQHRPRLDDLQKWTAALPANQQILAARSAPLARALASRDQFNTERDGLRLLVAIELFRAECKKPPASLNDLVPSFLPSVPADVFAADHLFRYTRTDPAKDPAGRAYLLYSVGSDGQDNGGKTHPASNTAALSGEAGRGYDFLVNPSREKPAH